MVDAIVRRVLGSKPVVAPKLELRRHFLCIRVVATRMTQGLFTEVLERFRAGDGAAEKELANIVYQDLRRIARKHLRGTSGDATLSPTSLVNESYMRLVAPNTQHVRTRIHFFRLASTIMRQIVCDYARAKIRESRILDRGLEANDALEMMGSAVADANHTLMVNEALEELFKSNERQARIAECRVFAGMTDDETAAALDTPLRTVQREWNKARKWLGVYVKDAKDVKQL
jgi:RNA polymerase sigma factor (TIGR02999 family)